MGLKAVLDAVVKRKIPSTRRESKPRTPIVQPVAQHYSYHDEMTKNITPEHDTAMPKLVVANQRGEHQRYEANTTESIQV